MTRLLAIVLLSGAWLFAGPQPGQCARRSDEIQLAGKSYLRLSDWAHAQGFEVRWLKKDETLQLVNHSAKIFLGMDSQEAVINGVAVRLLFPITGHAGVPYISQLDAQHTFQPVLEPPKNRSSARVKTICLDPGHGGRDPGNLVGSRQEKKYTLLLAQELRDQLGKAGFKVTLTRTTDSFVELPVRPDIARSRGADLFVSLHFNSFPQTSASGTEVYCLTPAGAPSTNARGEGGGAGWFAGNHFNEKNMFLAYLLQKSVTQTLKLEDRGVHRARFAVLRDAGMPAVLIEGGFMSNPVEGPRIFDAGFRKQMARAIVDGISSYKRQVERAS